MKRLLATAAPLALTAGILLAPATATAQNPNPYQRPDGSWITIGGTVQDVTPTSFRLDYGQGVVTVEMDESKRDAETGQRVPVPLLGAAHALQAGDTVDVTGKVDDDLYQTTSIEAASVYVERLDKYFYASSLDEDDRPMATVHLLHPNTTMFRGMVTEVGDEDFKVDRGPKQVTVRVDQMESNPLQGPDKIEVGDYVSVTATIDRNVFDKRLLEAVDVTELYHD